MITLNQREALEALTAKLSPAPTADEVWRPSRYDVPELHEKVVREILRGVNRARTDEDASPLGVAMQGKSGSGKTHLLGAVRDRIQQEGYFFLVGLLSGRTFWESVALAMVEGLGQPMTTWGTQHKKLFRRLTSQLGIPASVRDAIAGDVDLTRTDLDLFIRALRTLNRTVGRDCQDTARALVLNGARDFEAQDAGYAHLISEAGDPAARATWGMSPAVRPPQQIVRDISRLMALTLDPTVIAIDQIDTLFDQATAALFSRDALDESQSRQLAPVADGLLALRETTRRTLVVISCLPDTWELLKKSAPAPVIDRYRVTVLPDWIPTAGIAREIIAKRFAVAFNTQHFSPPYATWPIKVEAFSDAVDSLTPRELLRRVDRHIQRCLDRDEVQELDRLLDDGATPPQKVTDRPEPANGAKIDETFDNLVRTVDITAALDHKSEDAHMPALLAAGLAVWIDEQAPPHGTYKVEQQSATKPALHGRLIEVLNEARDSEAHTCFRAIASPNAVAVISRIRAASTKAGLDAQSPQRRLVILRRTPWPSGPRTKEVTDAFTAAGGIIHDISDHDLKTFAALKQLRAKPPKGFHDWLISRRPASATDLLMQMLGAASAGQQTPSTKAPSQAVPVPQTSLDSAPVSASRAQRPSVGLGYTAEGHRPFLVDLESLRRHTVIFAGSGSGKTVLIRRLVEECALQGVSSIVLDPNNDLARLGDAWPQPPDAWQPGDEQRARDYLTHTDVVVWTPRVNAGRPLAFQPLPDFGPVRDSPDEFDQVVRSAVEALAPRASVNGTTKLAQQGKAVLTEALVAYASSGAGGLQGFTEFLSDLPDGVSRMARAGKLAQDLAETLKAAMITDPLFGGDGTAADPGMLLTPPRGKHARISVISFIGLTSDEQKQSFVNQLQMALFAWIKSHPAGDRPLGGLFVMDEAQTLAPSTSSTASTASTISLASQARKYGLGLVFATQAPKGLHNQVSGNATTQFFGLLNSPAQIDAARELAQAKGGRLPDIGLLGSGQFYVASEAISFIKVQTPLCLTYHPKAPLSPEEVVLRARPS